MYWSVKSMYSDTISNVKFNKLYTDWFSINSGVRQGDTLSPTLFSLFINDSAKEIKAAGMVLLWVMIKYRYYCM